MKKIELTWPKESKAFQMYLAEVESGLAQAHAWLAKEKAQEDAEQSELCNFFHKMKGASGMFGLNELAQMAAGMEIMLKEQNTLDETKLEVFGKELDKASQYFKQLQQQLSE